MPAADVLRAAASHGQDRAPALQIQGLEKTFGDRKVLRGLDLEVAPGELLAILGANGSGKSTALRCVAGLLEPDSGTILIEGAAVAGRQMRVAMVFQQIHLVGRRTALANVCAGALGRLALSRSLVPRLFPAEVVAEAMSCLDRVGLADRADERVSRLSGGQQQRVAIARALCQRAGVVLADEPVAALDPAAAEQVMGLLSNLARDEDLAVAAVLHQPDLARRHASRVAGVLHGRVEFHCPPGDLSFADVDALYAPDLHQDL